MDFFLDAMLCCPGGSSWPAGGGSKQPCALPPPAAGSDLDTPSHRRRAHSVSIAGRSRSRSFTSSSSFAETIYTRKRSKTNDSRLQIGAPSHFRRVENNEHFSTPRRPAFRPLELSIYMPDNRLMPLPQFTANEPPALELEQQTLALAQILTRSNSVSSSSFSIPRKPLASSVLDLLLHDSSAGRASLDTHTSPSVTGDDWEAQPLRARPSLTHSLSSQDLLASMKSQSQVQLPKPVAMARARSNTEPPALWRSARPSEQYRRVEKALEARQVLDAKIRELDILLEHRVSAVLLSGHQSTRRKEGLGFSGKQ
ncbi:MAG: hypothetical protein M1829_002206 [Trizodia sp. TS-e1964]|nr:MAG: hypothetical protein M1829_002206 [Trizodia sp. TS-e1964]